MPTSTTKYNLSYLLFLASVSAMGGLLFGYDWVVIGGAKPFYESFFGITDSPSLQGWAMSSALIGCVFGAILSGVLADRIGRKIPLLLAAVLFTLSAFGTGYATEFAPFIIYRVIGGLGIGLASTLSPLYIAEIAPAHLRGRFVAINQLTIVLGILAAQIINYLIAEPVANDATTAQLLNSWNGQTGWRWMFWAELVPAVGFFALLFFVPKSPRFLIRQGERAAANKVLARIGGPAYATAAQAEIADAFALEGQTSAGWSDLKKPRVLPIVVIGIVLAIFQQWCGINVIFNYADEIFSAAGYGVGAMLFNVVITGSVNLLFTLLAMRTVDSWGRRRLMLIGSAGLALSYLLLGSAYYFGFQGWPILLLVVLSIGIYAMSLAPVTWVVLSEIFPSRIRGLAMSLATLSLWIACFILTYSFPIMNDGLGAAGTFWLYSMICLLGFLFIRARLPETKGKSLEEIEAYFANKTKAPVEDPASELVTDDIN